MAGKRSFGEFDMYIPATRIGIENDETKEFISNRSKGNIFWDVGSNIGYFPLYVAKSANYVRAFEPEPTNYNILEKNLQMNDFSNIKSHQIAISTEAGEAELFRSGSEGSGIHSLANDERLSEDTQTVSTQTIDNLVNRFEIPDFIKVDVEGAEMKVLEGAENSLEYYNIEWFIEVHSPRTDKRIDRIGQHNGDIESMYSKLKQKGYNIYGYQKGDLVDFHISDDTVPLHWFATKDDLSV
jgi:FkbM family methyltransferase